GHSRNEWYSRQNLVILKALLGHAKILYENAILYDENIRHAKVRLIEEKRYLLEKEKIMKDIHDGIGGITTNINLLAELAKNASSLPDIRKTLYTISEHSREGLSEIRGFIHSLDEREMVWEALISELRHFGTSMLEAHRISLVFQTSIREGAEQPNSLLYLILFRIYKEALTNVIKHSGAKSVKVSLAVGPEELDFSVKDDGVGLRERKGKGRGIFNMTARAREIAGRLSVITDHGACVSLQIPLPLKYPSEGMELSPPP
ncbi:MAG: hypothetical protein EHM36_01025, partial [Deltaproteobacteria bacterium]